MVIGFRNNRRWVVVAGRFVLNPAWSVPDACRTSIEDQFFDNALEVAGVIGDGLAVAGALTGNPVLLGVGMGLSIGSTALSGALNASQGDYVGLTGDMVGAGFGLIPGGRITRRMGGAAADLGRTAGGRFVANWRGKQAAQDILTSGMQERAAASTVDFMRCR